MKILITGSSGLVGHALQEEAVNSKHDMIFLNRNHGDLTDPKVVNYVFDYFKPDYVIHSAAKVGGISANSRSHADFYYQNILMNSHMLHYASKYEIKKFLAISSVCAFSGDVPLTEDNLHEKEPHEAEFAYGFSKRAMDIQIKAIKKQYDLDNYCSLISTNLFGKHDNYSLHNGHVIPSVMHKIYLAKKENGPLFLWGSGIAKREFLYAGDFAKIILKLLEKKDLPQRIIVSRNEEISIKEMVETLCEVAEFKGELVWDNSKPNGILSRPTDLSVLNSLIKDLTYVDFKEVLKDSWDWFVKNYNKVRK